MLPKGVGRANRLTNMNFLGVGGRLMRKVMRDKHVDDPADLLASLVSGGATLVACQMSMDVMGLRREELSTPSRSAASRPSSKRPDNRGQRCSSDCNRATRPLPTRAFLRVSVGRCGSNLENCASVSQDWARLAPLFLSEAANHTPPITPKLLRARTLAGPMRSLSSGLSWRSTSPCNRIPRPCASQRRPASAAAAR